MSNQNNQQSGDRKLIRATTNFIQTIKKIGFEFIVQPTTILKTKFVLNILLKIKWNLNISVQVRLQNKFCVRCYNWIR